MQEFESYNFEIICMIASEIIIKKNKIEFLIC